jgi:hypothetical protein
VDQSVWWPSFRLDDRIQFPPGREFLPSIHWATGSLASKVKRIGREAKNPTLSSVKDMNAWNYASTPHYVVMEWCVISAGD